MEQLSTVYLSKHSSSTFVYGTAGFRMDRVCKCRPSSPKIEIPLWQIRRHDDNSITQQELSTYSPSLTHIEDNGVKIVEDDGEMLAASWEECATRLANTSSFADLQTEIESIILTNLINVESPASIVVGRDTRPSGVYLAQIIQSVCESLGCEYVDYGVVTTPQLHYLVCARNDPMHGVATIEGYFAKMSLAYNEIVGSIETHVHVDCANGVGAVALDMLRPLIKNTTLTLHNTDTENEAVLNHDCGADYVKMCQSAPPLNTIRDGEMWASLDGDADRIVFYYAQSSIFQLLDGNPSLLYPYNKGDKIAILALEYISELVKIAGIDLKIGLVQTAYANGASTVYVEALGVPVVFTCTGVKHLHHAAKAFDIGVYFEANGHGTVIFSQSALASFQQENKDASHYQLKALRELYLLSRMINSCVGDALSDLLLVTLILSKSMTFEKWNASYHDLSSLQTKVLVADKSVFVPGNADMFLMEPQDVQECVDRACKGVKGARCFVRPSGTEDCVRVYCEASERSDVDTISAAVCGLIRAVYKPCLADKKCNE